MLIGLPGSGKSYFAESYAKQHPEKKYNMLGTNELLRRMKVTGLKRKQNYEGRWDALITKCTNCFDELLRIGSKRRRNFILDQTNVFPTARFRKLKDFKGFTMRAVVVIPEEEEFQKRLAARNLAEGNEIPESAVLNMKANFVLPEIDEDFAEVLFTDLGPNDAANLVTSYQQDAFTKGVNMTGGVKSFTGRMAKKRRELGNFDVVGMHISEKEPNLTLTTIIKKPDGSQNTKTVANKPESTVQHHVQVQPRDRAPQSVVFGASGGVVEKLHEKQRMNENVKPQPGSNFVREQGGFGPGPSSSPFGNKQVPSQMNQGPGFNQSQKFGNSEGAQGGFGTRNRYEFDQGSGQSDQHQFQGHNRDDSGFSGPRNRNRNNPFHNRGQEGKEGFGRNQDRNFSGNQNPFGPNRQGDSNSNNRGNQGFGQQGGFSKRPPLGSDNPFDSQGGHQSRFGQNSNQSGGGPNRGGNNQDENQQGFNRNQGVQNPFGSNRAGGNNTFGQNRTEDFNQGNQGNQRGHRFGQQQNDNFDQAPPSFGNNDQQARFGQNDRNPFGGPNHNRSAFLGQKNHRNNQNQGSFGQPQCSKMGGRNQESGFGNNSSTFGGDDSDNQGRGGRFKQQNFQGNQGGNPFSQNAQQSRYDNPFQPNRDTGEGPSFASGKRPSPAKSEESITILSPEPEDRDRSGRRSNSRRSRDRGRSRSRSRGRRGRGGSRRSHSRDRGSSRRSSSRDRDSRRPRRSQSRDRPFRRRRDSREDRNSRPPQQPEQTGRPSPWASGSGFNNQSQGEVFNNPALSDNSPWGQTSQQQLPQTPQQQMQQQQAQYQQQMNQPPLQYQQQINQLPPQFHQQINHVPPQKHMSQPPTHQQMSQAPPQFQQQMMNQPPPQTQQSNSGMSQVQRLRNALGKTNNQEITQVNQDGSSWPGQGTQGGWGSGNQNAGYQSSVTAGSSGQENKYDRFDHVSNYRFGGPPPTQPAPQQQQAPRQANLGGSQDSGSTREWNEQSWNRMNRSRIDQEEVGFNPPNPNPPPSATQGPSSSTETSPNAKPSTAGAPAPDYKALLNYLKFYQDKMGSGKEGESKQ